MGIFDFLFGVKKQPVPASVPTPAAVPETVVKPQPEQNPEEVKARISEVLSTDFPSSDIRENVSATELCNLSGITADVHPACTPVDFVAVKDGKPYLAVVVVRPNNYRGMNVIGTKKICDDAGITYIRFFTNMPNEKAYIKERLKNLI